MKELFGRPVETLPAAGGRLSRGEHRGYMAVAVIAAIGLQAAVPEHLGLRPHFLMPVLEGALLVALVLVSPGRINRISSIARFVTTLLLAALSLANTWSLVLLIHGLVNGSAGQQPAPLLLSAAAIWGTNVIVFAVWYWEFDRGGPAARSMQLRPYPDFLFPQQTSEGSAPPGWKPAFLDYFYTSFTNATAFSPTDTMPLSTWAKMLFLVQSGISLVTAALVVARVANILK